MKQIEFKTSNGEFTLVELYDKIDKTSLSLDSGFLTYRDHIGWDGMRIMDSDCISLGCIQDITEEQAKEVVDFHLKGGLLKCYYDYEKGYYSNSLYTAIASLQSLLKVNGVVFENTPCNNCQNGCPVCSGLGNLQDSWDKSQTYIYKKS